MQLIKNIFNITPWRKYIPYSIILCLTLVQFTIFTDVFRKIRTRPLSLYDVDLNCSAAFSGDSRALFKLQQWKFDPEIIEEMLISSENKCETISDLFDFIKTPLSDEEKDFPLAYGALVHNEIVQVFLMLSSIYHPQNEYCFAISGSASESFKKLMIELPKCFQNVHILHRPPISWGSFEIINSTYVCLEYLSKLKTNWRYYQYLSGTDVPLKTNLEMVRIFKAWNGTPNIDFVPLERYRWNRQNPAAAPLPLIKATLSAAIARDGADYISNSTKTTELLKYLKSTLIPDESFWGTLFGNKKVFPVPGSFDATELISHRRHLMSMRKSQADQYLWSLEREEQIKNNYYVARIQYWSVSQCQGIMVKESCAFGVTALPNLMQQPHLVAHKFYLDYEPAGTFCALKEIRRRSLSPEPFSLTPYLQLPLVEYQRGIPLQNLTNPMWLFSIFGVNLRMYI